MFNLLISLKKPLYEYNDFLLLNELRQLALEFNTHSCPIVASNIIKLLIAGKAKT